VDVFVEGIDAAETGWNRSAEIGIMRAFPEDPAIVATLDDLVDLFVGILSDIARPEIAGGGVERHPPDVAQAGGPELGADGW
jgi:hypothetical protein